MYTECPSCHTFFKITPGQLKAAEGKVRCGRCDTVFNAIANLAEEVPQSDSHVVHDEFENIAQSQISPSFADVEIPGMDAGMDAGMVESPVAEIGTANDNGLELMEPSAAAVSEMEMDLLEPEAQPSEHAELDIEEELFSRPAIDEDAMGEMVGEGEALQPEAAEGFENLDLAGDLELEAEAEPALEQDDIALSQLDLEEEFAQSDGPDFLPDDGMEMEMSPESEQGLELDLSDEGPQVAEAADGGFFNTEQELADLENSIASLDDEPPSALRNVEIEEDISEPTLSEPSRFGEPEEAESAEEYVLQELGDKEKKSWSWIATISWIIVIAVLLLVLLLQFAYFKREELAKYPQVRPMLEKMCDFARPYFECDVPQPKDLKAIELLERDVRTHPTTKGALLISSTIISKAAFVQPFPKLELTFSDINEMVIARRVFKPAEYLSKDIEIENGMTPDLPVRIMLEIVDPGADAVNFEFNFK